MDILVVSGAPPVMTSVSQPSQLTLVNQSVVLQGGSGSTPQAINRIAAQNLSGHTCVGANSSGSIIVASSDTPAILPIGVTTGAAATGAAVIVQIGGEIIESSWSWDVTKPVFLGLGGVLTQTPPTTGVVTTVGYPTKPTGLLIEIDSIQIA